MGNIWLDTNRRMLDYLRRVLIESGYQPIYQDFPIKKVELILNGFESELVKLQNENDKLKQRVKNLENYLKDQVRPSESDVNPNEDDTTQPV